MDVPDRILVVDDDASTRDALADLLRDSGFSVDTASNGSDALAIIARDPPSLIVSDVRMPRASGIQMVQTLRAHPRTAHVPVILISALVTRDRRLAGLDCGADDYIDKPVDFDELLARIRVHLRHVHWQRELERRALLDPLTGTLNRRGLITELRRAHAAALHDKTPLSIVMADVDRFKALNDEHGHQLGDTALRQIGRALVDMVRTVDRVGRLGGDEFVVIAPGIANEDAEALAERLRRHALPPLSVADGRTVALTMSLGTATLVPGETIDALLDRADRDMYLHKRRFHATGPPPSGEAA